MTSQMSTADKVINPGKVVGENRVIDTEVLAEKVDAVRERARNLAQKAKDRAVELEGEFEGYVRAHPVKAVAMAAGVGALLGFAIGALVARR